MSYLKLEDKKNYYNENKHLIDKEVVQNYANYFRVDYTHNSTAIEGNTISLAETKLLLEDKVSIAGKDLREVYEIINHNKAFDYIQKCILEDEKLSENIVKDIHEILMDHIMQGGIYRKVDVYISGAKYTPPTPNNAYNQIKSFFAELSLKQEQLSAIEYAAWIHAEFVRIHPFVDGNGRVSRLIMNYQLMSAGYLPISIPKERKLEYFNALEDYACDNNLNSFSDLVAKLEEVQLDRYIKAIDLI